MLIDLNKTVNNYGLIDSNLKYQRILLSRKIVLHFQITQLGNVLYELFNNNTNKKNLIDYNIIVVLTKAEFNTLI